MIERGLITAAIVVVIIGAMGALGEQVNLMSENLACRMQANAVCDINPDSQNDPNSQNGQDTISKRKNENQ